LEEIKELYEKLKHASEEKKKLEHNNRKKIGFCLMKEGNK